MCTNKKIDDVLKKLGIYRDTKDMRQIIEKADLCHECPEVLQTTRLLFEMFLTRLLAKEFLKSYILH